MEKRTRQKTIEGTRCWVGGVVRRILTEQWIVVAGRDINILQCESVVGRNIWRSFRVANI